MPFEWNKDTIGWQLAAAEYTGYAENMAKLLLPKITGRGSLCDIGCGMALVDFALAPYVDRVTCVDLNENALNFVREHAARLGTAGLEAIRADGSGLSGQWDTVMALFHGEIEANCENYLRKARRQFIAVTHGSAGRGAEHTERCNYTDVLTAWLDERGYTYQREDGALEFGQPHRSMEDAVASTAAYNPKIPPDAIRENVLQTAVETGREDFPYYTPKTRKFSIFVIPRAENAHLL